MSIKPKQILLTYSLCLWSLLLSSNALAVGGGVPFQVHESIPGGWHNFQADSMDFTYHACTTVDPANNVLVEKGYFWISSYQNPIGVVDSEINYFRANGYHIYGIYRYQGNFLGAANTPLGLRADYGIPVGSIDLYLDPNEDTQLTLSDNCQVQVTVDADDQHIGGSAVVVAGEKSEKVGLANGDFEVRFVNWMWNVPAPIVPFASNVFVFNANVTRLGGPLNGNHNPEGSGNLFWLNN